MAITRGERTGHNQSYGELNFPNEVDASRVVSVPRSDGVPNGKRPRLGATLVASGVITEAQLAEAIEDQQSTGERLGTILVGLGYATREQVTRAVSVSIGVTFVDLEENPIDVAAAMLLPESLARAHRVLPIGTEDDRLIIAAANPRDVVALDNVRMAVQRPIRVVMADEEQLVATISRIWRASEVDDFEIDADDDATDLASLLAEVDDGPIVRFVNSLVNQAVDERASDIHLEPTATDLRVRFRVDGVLHDVPGSLASVRHGVVSRLKVMSNIDIAERRLPQDGRVTLSVAGRKIDIRVATLPTNRGEAVVMRLLDKERGVPKLDDLGILPTELARYRERYLRPHGATVVTGPTGSGKTTTLYATLQELNKDDRSIVTVEDPIEYEINGAKQIQINRKAGLSFASALRAILRNDPDVILVGEIRDVETARTAADAALTGHRVLSTLHTNDAASTPLRLIEMGLEPFMVTAALDCVVAQRLCRQLCPRCKESYVAGADELHAAQIPEALLGENPLLWRAVGCQWCRKTGFQGRFAVVEIMPVSEEIDRLIVARGSTDEILRQAVAEGMITLRNCGFHHALQGQTTLEEVFRVVA